MTRETSKNDHSWKTSYRHGHTALTRTAADGCGRLDNVQRTQLYPHTPRVKREPLLRIREKYLYIYTEGLLYTDACTQKNTFTQRGFYAEKLARTEILTHRSLHTQKLLHTEAFRQKNLHGEKL